eukprot:gene1975-3841_t
MSCRYSSNGSLPLFFLFLKYGSTFANIVDLYGYNWVVAMPGESHAKSCQRIGLHITEVRDIEWNRTIYENVVNGLHFQNDSLIAIGVQHCCIPGLWCGPSGCFTSSYNEQFSNYGWLSNDYENFPVFSCKSYDLETIALIDTVSIHQNALVTISGYNFDNDGNNIKVSVSGEQCTNIEMCSDVCQSCAIDPCPKDSICLIGKYTENCFIYCAGINDKSCPCNTFCEKELVSLYTRLGPIAIPVHLCTPNSFLTYTNYNTDVCSKYDNGLDELQCVLSQEKQYLQHKYYENSNSNSNNNNQTTIISNIYKMSTLEPVSVNCPTSISYEIRSQQTPFTYKIFKLKSNIYAKMDFESKIIQSGYRSSVSYVDDYPVETYDFRFPFIYFGNLIKKFAINPNGAIHLSPIPRCNGEYNSITCIVYATFTNVISLWASDWDPGHLHMEGGSFTEVRVLEQTEGDGTVVTGIDTSAVHVLFRNVFKYVEFGLSFDPTKHNTFSTSLYSDSSIRMRYHSVHDQALSTDIFGLWAARASQEDHHAYNRYHEENITRTHINITDDIIFCKVSTVACILNACVYPGGTLKLKWNGTNDTCVALGKDVHTAVVCEWMGGVSRTNATWDKNQDQDQDKNFLDGDGNGNGGSNILSCAVPILPLESTSIISVELKIHILSSNDNDDDDYVEINNESPDKKAVHGIYQDRVTGEIARSHLMVRYIVIADHTSASSTSTMECGCNALDNTYGGGGSSSSGSSMTMTTATCDSCHVCGGRNRTVDCNGDCHGVAYTDSCDKCSGGLSDRVPVDSCDFPQGLSNLNLNLFPEAIVLLVMMFLVTLAFSTALYIFRLSLSSLPFLNHVEGGGRGGALGLGLERLTRLSRGLTEDELRSIGEYLYRPNDNTDTMAVAAAAVINFNDNSIECPICLVEILIGDECRKLPVPCGHIFHKACIDIWFHNNTSCPMCKRSVRTMLAPDTSSRGRAGNNAAAAGDRDRDTIDDSEGSVGLGDLMRRLDFISFGREQLTRTGTMTGTGATGAITAAEISHSTYSRSQTLPIEERGITLMVLGGSRHNNRNSTSTGTSGGGGRTILREGDDDMSEDSQRSLMSSELNR